MQESVAGLNSHAFAILMIFCFQIDKHCRGVDSIFLRDGKCFDLFDVKIVLEGLLVELDF